MKPVHDAAEAELLHKTCLSFVEVMKSLGICGYVVLQGRNTTNYIMNFEAPWSALKFERLPNGDIVAKFRALRQTGADPALERKKAEWTMGMLIGFSDQLRRDKEQIDGLIKRFATHFGQIDHVSAPNPPPPDE